MSSDQATATGAGPDTDKSTERSLAKQRHVDIVSMLCKAGARINCKDSKNLTPLHYACRSNSEVSTN